MQSQTVPSPQPLLVVVRAPQSAPERSYLDEQIVSCRLQCPFALLLIVGTFVLVILFLHSFNSYLTVVQEFPAAARVVHFLYPFRFPHVLTISISQPPVRTRNYAFCARSSYSHTGGASSRKINNRERLHVVGLARSTPCDCREKHHQDPLGIPRKHHRDAPSWPRSMAYHSTKTLSRSRILVKGSALLPPKLRNLKILHYSLPSRTCWDCFASAFNMLYGAGDKTNKI